MRHRSLTCTILGTMLVVLMLQLLVGTARLTPTASAQAPQAAGDELWDDRFVVPGTESTLNKLAVAADGSLYAVIETGKELLRWNGRNWQSIGDVETGFINAIATIGNTLYAAGSFQNIGTFPVKFVARWTGTAWEQVGTGTGPKRVEEFGTVEGSFETLAVIGTTLYVGGAFNRLDGVAANSVAAWNGSGWSAVGSGIRDLDFDDPPQPTRIGKVNVLIPHAGRLYAGGEFQHAGAQPANSIAVWDGSAWSSFGDGLILERDGFTSRAIVNAIAVNGNTLYAGGEFTKAGNTAVNNIAAWNGTAWTALGTGITGNPYQTKVNALLADGPGVLVGGYFEAAGGNATPAFARWTGTSWQAVVTDLTNLDTVRALVPTEGGYYVGGDFQFLGDLLVENVARRTATGWQALGQGLTDDPNRCCAGRVYAVANDGAGHVYVGGDFQTAGGVRASNIAMWDGDRWHSLGAGIGEGYVSTLLLHGNDLYVGGTFKTAGGASIPYLARWNTATQQWSGLGSGVNADVNALEFVDGVLYVGGDMSTAGGVAVSNIAAWNGTNWSALSQKLIIRTIFDNCSEAGTQVYAIKASGRYLAIGGNFRLVQTNLANPCAKESYFPANHILLWDRIDDEWYTLGGDGRYGLTGGGTFGARVRALETVGGTLDAGGTLYVGGEFDGAGTQPAQNLARWTLADGWQAMSGVTGGTTSSLAVPGINSLAASGSVLFMGGNFTTAGSGPANYIARYNTLTNSWSALGSGTNSAVFALTLAPDGVFIGGEKVSQAGGKPSAGFGHWMEPQQPEVTTTALPPTATTRPPTATTLPPTATTPPNPGNPSATPTPTTVINPGNPTPTATTRPAGSTRVFLPFVRR